MVDRVGRNFHPQRQFVASLHTTRLDGGRVRIASEGNEMLLADILRSHLDVRGKIVLVIPSFGTPVFQIKTAGARQVWGADPDPVQLTWLSLVQKYFRVESFGSLLTRLADISSMRERDFAALSLMCQGYPPSTSKSDIFFQELRKMSQSGRNPAPLRGVAFCQARLGTAAIEGVRNIREVLPSNLRFDVVYVPHLLGEENGITSIAEITTALEDIWQLSCDRAQVLISPARQGIDQALRPLFKQGKYDRKVNRFHVLGACDTSEMMLTVRK